MKKLEDICDKILQGFDFLTVIALAGMVAVVFFNAVLRYVFNTGIMVSEELARFLFIWMCLLGSVVAYRKKNHIYITVITDMLPPKAKVVVQCIARIITTVAIIFLCYGSVLYIQNTSQYMNSGIRINYGIVMSVLPIMAFSMLAIDILECVRFLEDRKEKGKQLEGGADK